MQSPRADRQDSPLFKEQGVVSTPHPRRSQVQSGIKAQGLDSEDSCALLPAGSGPQPALLSLRSLSLKGEISLDGFKGPFMSEHCDSKRHPHLALVLLALDSFSIYCLFSKWSGPGGAPSRGVSVRADKWKLHRSPEELTGPTKEINVP